MKTPALSLTLILALTSAAHAEGDVAKGEKAAKKCMACHAFTADAPNKTGPTLFGIIGRKTGSVEGYAYSNVMKAWGEEGHVWTPGELDAFLEAPRAVRPGNKMTFAGIKKPEERADLIAYLATLTE